MTKCTNPPGILLPADWSQHARSAMLHVISLAQFALAYTRGWAVNSRAARHDILHFRARVLATRVV